MKILNVIKCEFIKNYNFKNLLLIIAILLLSVIVLTKLNIREYRLDDKINFNNLINVTKSNLEENKNISYLPLRQKYYDYLYNRQITLLNHLKNDIYKEDVIGVNNKWQYDIAIETILRKEKVIILSDILLHERDNEEIKRAISNPSSDLFESNIYLWQDYSDKELIEMADTAKKEIKDLENLIDNGNYYDYKVWQLRNGYSSIEKIKFYQEMIMKRKINDANNYNYQNIYNYDMFFINSKELVSANKKYPNVTKDEFKNDNNLNTTYANYETYQNAYKLYRKDYTAKMHIIEYAIENNLPSNILNGNVEYPVFTAANNVNTMPKLSFIVMLVIVLTSSGIITNEYNRGIKILFTSNIKRWKILLGKFIYLILHSYILWLVLFIILYIYSGVIFDFKDFSYPTLIYTGNKVIEINYIIYNLIKIVILNIPLIAFISLIILLSTIINSNIFITMISTIISILSSFIWSLICEYHLTFLTKNIIPYFNLYEIIKHHNILSNFNTTFQDVLCFCNTNLNKGLIISFITIIINYFIANYLFNKKEI